MMRRSRASAPRLQEEMAQKSKNVFNKNTLPKSKPPPKKR